MVIYLTIKVHEVAQAEKDTSKRNELVNVHIVEEGSPVSKFFLDQALTHPVCFSFLHRCELLSHRDSESASRHQAKAERHRTER